MHLDPYAYASYVPLMLHLQGIIYDKLDTMLHLGHQLKLRVAATHQGATVVPEF